ncbi:MAG TPA: oxidoreductase [Clostridiales bacterium]|nr:oxidoreductase [Clostridiales bacterium]
MKNCLQDIVVPHFNLTGKVAIVTGGTKGLGYGMAVILSEYGADVVVASRTEEDCIRVETELRSLGRNAYGVVTDVTKEDQVNNLIETVVKKLGRVDIMVCNAGIANTVAALDMTEKEWDMILDVNLKGVFFSARAAANQMIKQGEGGRIINISSAASECGAKGISNYCAAKAGVVNLTRALASEWARYGITVNTVSPGYVPTSINEKQLSNQKVKEGIEKATMLKRLGKIEEVALPVLMLASDFSGYITGAQILVDGGVSAQ